MQSSQAGLGGKGKKCPIDDSDDDQLWPSSCDDQAEAGAGGAGKGKGKAGGGGVWKGKESAQASVIVVL